MAAKRPLRVLCAREVQKSIKDSVHRLLCDQIEMLGLSDHYDILETEIRGRYNESLFLFTGLGTQTVESIKSFEGVDICWVEEAKNVSKKSWDVLLPTIRKDDSEIWVSFNPDLETDETYQRFVKRPPDGAVVVQINWQDNPNFPDVLNKERLNTLKNDPDSYRNIWEGEPNRVAEGAVYAKEVAAMYADKRVRPVPYDPLLKVHTVWDLGWNDATSIGFFQRSGAEFRMIDYEEESFVTLDEWVAKLEKKPYRYGYDWLPHDAQAKRLENSGKSTQDILRKLNRKTRIVPNDSVENGIRAVRMVFPRLYVNEDKCERFLEVVKRYRRHISNSTNEPGAPRHDEFSHGADMLRYAAQVVDKMQNEEQDETFPFVASGGGRTGY
jgi:phage terminase large subunit